MRKLLLVLFLASCAGTAGRTSTRAWDGGSSPMPVVAVESAEPSFEVVMTTPERGIQVPMVQQRVNPYGRMNLTVWIRNTGRSQRAVEVQAKFFDASGAPLDAGGWTEVFVDPGEARQVDLVCREEGASTFKVLVR